MVPFVTSVKIVYFSRNCCNLCSLQVGKHNIKALAFKANNPQSWSSYGSCFSWFHDSSLLWSWQRKAYLNQSSLSTNESQVTWKHPSRSINMKSRHNLASMEDERARISLRWNLKHVVNGGCLCWLIGYRSFRMIEHLNKSKAQIRLSRKKALKIKGEEEESMS